MATNDLPAALNGDDLSCQYIVCVVARIDVGNGMVAAAAAAAAIRVTAAW